MTCFDEFLTISFNSTVFLIDLSRKITIFIMRQALPYEINDDFLNMNLENISKGQFRTVFGLKWPEIGLKLLQFVKNDFLKFRNRR